MAFAMIDEFVAVPAELVFVVPDTVVVFVTVTFTPIANKTFKVTNEFLALFKFQRERERVRKRERMERDRDKEREREREKEGGRDRERGRERKREM